jgi:hypothetical protein
MLGEIVSVIAVAVIDKFMAEFFPGPHGTPGPGAPTRRPVPVALKANSGHFVCADLNRGGLLVADRPECREYLISASDTNPTHASSCFFAGLHSRR